MKEISSDFILNK